MGRVKTHKGKAKPLVPKSQENEDSGSAIARKQLAEALAGKPQPPRSSVISHSPNDIQPVFAGRLFATRCSFVTLRSRAFLFDGV